MDEQMTRRYWGISIGKGGRYVPHARHGNFIAVHWSELNDLQAWEQRHGEDTKRVQDEFFAFYKERVPEETALGIQAGQLWNFAVAMKPGDIALVRDPVPGKVHIAEVAGPYKYVQTPDDGCEYQHRKAVRWVRGNVAREELPEGLRTSLGSLLTIFSLDKHRDAIEYLMGGPPPLPPPERDVVRHTRERLMDLAPHRFQQFVGDLLSLAGFSVVVNRIGPDGGVDIFGTLNAENLAEISVRVQVKRIAGNAGIKEVLQLRGSLVEQDHSALFITLGAFTKAAKEEAEAPGKKKIRLIDGQGVIDLVLKHYDELPVQYRELLGLKRREIPLREQFTVSAEMERHDPS